MAFRIVLASFLLLAGPARVGAQDWPGESFNPDPQPDDLVLPLPCGGGMAFRPVATPEQANDVFGVEVSLGLADYGASIGESQHLAHVAGPFRSADDDMPLFYLGKYEVTIDQYNAVQSSVCRDPTRLGSRPASDVSWQEAVAFGHAYTLWLLENAVDSLPRVGQAYGFLRLPTSTEWEYAARGGSAVSQDAFGQRLFPMDGPISQYVWYQGADSANGRMRPVGLLRPNPLGLHDILGNAEELVFDPLRVGGLVGGFTTMGGSIQTPAERLRTSMRIEYFYIDPTRNAPTRIDTFGFRLAISAPIQSSFQRIAEIRQALEAEGRAPSPTITEAVDEREPAFDPIHWRPPETLEEAAASTVILRSAFAAIAAEEDARLAEDRRELEEDYRRILELMIVPDERDPFETAQDFERRQRDYEASVVDLEAQLSLDLAEVAALSLERKVRRMRPLVQLLAEIQAQAFPAPEVRVQVEMLAPQPEQSRIPILLIYEGDEWPSYWGYEDVLAARRVWQRQDATETEAFVALGPGYPDDSQLKQVIVQVRLSNSFGPAERMIAVDDVAPFPEIAGLEVLADEAVAARDAVLAIRVGRAGEDSDG